MPDPSGAPDPPLHTVSEGELNRALSRAMVGAKKEFYGRGPEHAQTYIVDDFAFVVMRGGKTTAEDTMLEAGEKDMVRAYRQIFQNQMEERLIGTVEQLTGRKILTYQSQLLFDPFTVIEIFMFDRPLDGAERSESQQ